VSSLLLLLQHSKLSADLRAAGGTIPADCCCSAGLTNFGLPVVEHARVAAPQGTICPLLTSELLAALLFFLAGNGFPIGGLVTNRDLAAAFAAGGMEYFNTYGELPAQYAYELACELAIHLNTCDERELRRQPHSQQVVGCCSLPN
jgi:hypothetical protein